MDRLRTSLCDLLNIEYPILQSGAAQDIYAAATQQQNREYFPMHAGQSVGMVHDLPGAAEVVETLVREARAALQALGERVRLG